MHSCVIFIVKKNFVNCFLLFIVQTKTNTIDILFTSQNIFICGDVFQDRSLWVMYTMYYSVYVSVVDYFSKLTTSYVCYLFLFNQSGISFSCIRVLVVFTRIRKRYLFKNLFPIFYKGWQVVNESTYGSSVVQQHRQAKS